MGVPPFHVEKDFWVCWVLAALFNDPELGGSLTFRGGTSLSKAWGVIRRFSEDVDLALGRSELDNADDPAEAGVTENQRRRRLSALRASCRAVINDQLVPGLQRALREAGIDGRVEIESLAQARDPFCVYVYYPQTGLAAPLDYIQSRVKVELSGRADDWPREARTISPYVTTVLQDVDVARRMELTLDCVRPERTFWEKAALLNEHHARPTERELPRAQARHLYDVVRLWEAQVQETEGFRALFDGVKAHREAFFDYTWINYDELSPAHLRLCPSDKDLREWRLDYENMRAMFHESPPTFDELIQKLRTIENALSRL